MSNHSPKDLPGTSEASSTREDPASKGSPQPDPKLDQVIRGFSTSLEALKGIIRELAAQKEQEAAAAQTYKALQEYYRDLFNEAPGGYLVTDTEVTIQGGNQAAADLLQADKDFLLGKGLSFFVIPDDQETINSLLDQARQGRVTRESLVHLQPAAGEPLTISLTIGGRRNPAGELTGFNCLMQGYTLRRQEEEIAKDQLTRLERRFTGLVEVFSAASEIQDPYSAGHQRRVAQMSCGIAEQMGFSPDRVAGMKIMGYLHDVGKVAIPSEILNKVGLLTLVECQVVKTHPQLGYDLLKDLEFPWPVAQAILQHHERWNGSGYPSGLAGGDIIIEARILAVADVVEAMVSPRPYGVAVGIEKALEEVYKEAGVLYDHQVVDASLKLFVEKGFKFA